MNYNNTTTLVFDLGGVILNLNMERALLEISGFMGTDPFDLKHAYINHPFLREFELGLLDKKQFRLKFRKMLRADLEDKHLDELWNLMLADIPDERIQWIKDLRNRYQVVLLSNTNELHIEAVNNILSNKSLSLEVLFDKVYYSFAIHERKPEKEAFEYVLNDLGISPKKAVMFDDDAHNIDTAASLGMHYVHVPHNDLSQSMLPNGK